MIKSRVKTDKVDVIFIQIELFLGNQAPNEVVWVKMMKQFEIFNHANILIILYIRPDQMY